MPRRTQWLDDLRVLVDSGMLSYGELQSGTYHDRVGRHKTGEKAVARMSASGKVYTTYTPIYDYPEQKVYNKGTGIPASTISRIFSGEFSPSRSTLTILRNFHKRYAYNELRSAGASTSEARRLRSRSDWYVKRDRYQYVVGSTADRIKQPVNAVLWGYMHSQSLYQDWEDWGSPEIYDSEGDLDIEAMEQADRDYSLGENDFGFDPEPF